METEATIPRHVKRFVRRLGLRVHWNVPLNYAKYNWTGRVLNTEPTDVEMQLHDVAHWLVCPPERRKLPEFGLGSDQVRESNAKQVLSNHDADEEEYLACAMQLAIVVYLGLDPNSVTAEVNTLYIADDKMAKIRKLLPLPKHEMAALESKLWAIGRRKRYGDGTDSSQFPSRETIRCWLIAARAAGAKSIISVRDTFDNYVFPVWVMPEENEDEKYEECDSIPAQKAIGFYDINDGSFEMGL